MISKKNAWILPITGLALFCLIIPANAGYKARPWNILSRNGYAASLTSEGVTIAVEPLYTDALASQIFDRNDIVSRGIVPIGVIVFNDNDFPVEVDGLSIQLIHGKDHIHTLSPNEVVYRLYKKDRRWLGRPATRIPRSELNEDALADFDQKFLLNRVIPPHEKGGGFIYLHVLSSENLISFLSKSLIYIPNVYRRDNDSKLIFFEIDVNPALKDAPQE